MKFQLFKWLGTIVIIFIGIISAFYLTDKGSIYEQKFYNVVLDEYVFDIQNSKTLKCSWVLGLNNEEKAKAIMSKKDNIIKEIASFLKKYPIEKINEDNDLTVLKIDLLKHFVLKDYDIYYLMFNSNPKIY